MVARFWDNSKERHGSLLWEGPNPWDWEHWEKWRAEGRFPKSRFWDVSLEFEKAPK